MSKKPKNSKIKAQLFLKCGTVDMYDLKIYDKAKLTLHHYPPFRETHHTIFSESYLITRDNHDYIENLDNNNPEEYKETMEQMEKNKIMLLKKKGDVKHGSS